MFTAMRMPPTFQKQMTLVTLAWECQNFTVSFGAVWLLGSSGRAVLLGCLCSSVIPTTPHLFLSEGVPGSA